jgi:hypothetical protein
MQNHSLPRLIQSLSPRVRSSAARRGGHPRHRNIIGNPLLCAWMVAPGICWVQTRSPVFARKLSRRADSCLVACGVAGGYLRTFAFHHGLSWARRLIARYTRNGMATNEQFLNPNTPVTCRSEQNGSVWRVRNQNAAVKRWEQEIA